MDAMISLGLSLPFLVAGAVRAFQFVSDTRHQAELRQLEKERIRAEIDIIRFRNRIHVADGVVLHPTGFQSPLPYRGGSFFGDSDASLLVSPVDIQGQGSGGEGGGDPPDFRNITDEKGQIIRSPKTTLEQGQVDQIVKLDADGYTPSQISEMVFGHKNGRRVNQVKWILDQGDYQP